MPTYEIQIPKILYLAFFISKYAKNAVYYNTNDLIELANDIKPDLVRTRKDKNDYKFLDDTNFGGLRGNFSTVLTLRGIAKVNNRYTPFYGIGKKDVLFNAFSKGNIILDPHEYKAYTNQLSLYRLLLSESFNFSIRENQAHIKIFLKNNYIGLSRDELNFPKVAVLKSHNNVYFLRILFNTFITQNVIEYNMYNYLSGTKIKSFNMHPMFVIPSKSNYWDTIYVIDSKLVLKNKPLFIYYDLLNDKFYDLKGNVYPHYNLEDGINNLSDQSGNISLRLSYDWQTVRDELVSSQIKDSKDVESDEFYLFLVNFLQWNKKFKIESKNVVDLVVSSSGGADVILEFSGGTKQTLELEHKWVNYIKHGHYKSLAWKGAWLFADEPWDFELIKNIFKPYISQYIDCIPNIFLSCEEKA